MRLMRPGNEHFYVFRILGGYPCDVVVLVDLHATGMRYERARCVGEHAWVHVLA
jgi:hypothetical protein